MTKHRILIVEDEKNVRDTLALILQAAGYSVSTAVHGFDALLQLKDSELPNLIVSDLNMPHMSGFEFLSVVRRRFPHIPVIASSGAYHSGDSVPGGIIADGFYAKVGSGPATLLSMVAALLATSADGIHVTPVPRLCGFQGMARIPRAFRSLWSPVRIACALFHLVFSMRAFKRFRRQSACSARRRSVT